MKENITIKKKLVLKKQVKKFLNQTLLTILIFLIGMILVKSNPDYKNSIIKNIYEKNFKFTKIKKIYEKYFGNILSADKIIAEEKTVFSEKLNYKKNNVYKDGVVLTVDDNYMVPVLESGIVVYIGDKKEYGSTIIVEQVNGINTYYSNINPSDIKLYDYVEKGKLLGEAKSNKLYLVFEKDGKFLDYKKYI